MFLLPNDSAIRLPVLIQPLTKFIEWRSGQQGAIRLSMGLRTEALAKKYKNCLLRHLHALVASSSVRPPSGSDLIVGSPRLAKAPVAQLDRASDYGSGGWEFESSRAHHRNQYLKKSAERRDLFLVPYWYQRLGKLPLRSALCPKTSTLLCTRGPHPPCPGPHPH